MLNCDLMKTSFKDSNAGWSDEGSDDPHYVIVETYEID